MSKYSPQQKIWSENYKRNNYDKILLYVQKGKREEIKQYAASLGISVNNLLNNLITQELHEKNMQKK